MLLLLVAVYMLASVSTISGARLFRRQTNFGGNSGGGGDEAVPSTDTRFLFGNNGLFGGLFGGNDCACVTDGRRRRQAEVDTKFFFGGGSSACNCPAPSSEFAPVTDCKGRPEGDTFYDCGCGGGGGGLFGIGRRKRQTNLGGDSINTKFLDFRCIGATILGRTAT